MVKNWTREGIPEGLSVRPLAADDLDAVLGLLDALTEDVHGESMSGRSDLVVAYTDPGFDPAQDGLAVVDADGSLVAAAFVAGRGLIEVLTERDDTGKALFTVLLDACLERAREKGEPEVSTMVGDVDHGRRGVVESRGFEVHHTGWIMELPELVSVPPRDVRSPYAIRPMTMDDAPAAHDVIETAFSEWEGRTRHPYEEWARATVERPGIDLSQSRVATRTHDDGREEVVGACIAFDVEHRGTWVHHLAVSDDHRGEGLAQALMASAYRGGKERGRLRGGLATDSRMKARTLYERLGLRVLHTVVTYSLTLD